VSTLAIIEEILKLSGPFASDAARNAHRRWLEGLPTNKLEQRRTDLLASLQRPSGQGQLGLRYSR